MKIYKICTKKDRGQGKKANWPEIGILFEDDKGHISGYLNNAPDVKIYLFPQDIKQQQRPATQNNGVMPEFDISEEVPF